MQLHTLYLEDHLLLLGHVQNPLTDDNPDVREVSAMIEQKLLWILNGPARLSVCQQRAVHKTK